jgi:hypothetical protein
MTINLDISTSIIGVAIFNEEHNIHDFTHFKFNEKDKNLFNKLNAFMKFLEKYKDIELTELAVEEPLERFHGKFSSSSVIVLLQKFNAMICTAIYLKYGLEPVFYNVKSARKLAFPTLIIPNGHPNAKHLVWEAFSKAFPLIHFEYSKKTFKLVEGTYDSVDAAVIGLAHIVSKIKNKQRQILIQS